MTKLLTSALLVAAALLAGCTRDDGDQDRDTQRRGGTSSAERDAEIGDAGPVHVHGLGVNPADDALFMATHTGLFRQSRPGATPRRVADRHQDTMGFAVIGPNRFLASGHPDGREGLPPFLGLIESRDAGRTWTSVSLQGEMDFHVLEAAGARIYGYGTDWETRAERLLVSDDGGRSWQERRAPEPLMDLAIDPSDPDRAVAAGRSGLEVALGGGRRWHRLDRRPGLLAWTSGGLYSVDLQGVVRLARHDLSRPATVGRVGGKPAAFAAAGRHELYVALHDGTIKRSRDGGRSWHTGDTPRHMHGDRREGADRQRGRSPRSRSEAFRRRCAALRDISCEGLR